MVLASRGGICREELGQGDCHAQITHARSDQTCIASSHCVSFDVVHSSRAAGSIPQTTLTLPPEGKLSDKLAAKAVHEFRMANARPSMDLNYTRKWSAGGLGWDKSREMVRTYSSEKCRFNSGLCPIWANCSSSSTWRSPFFMAVRILSVVSLNYRKQGRGGRGKEGQC